jgi:hypothetical protein
MLWVCHFPKWLRKRSRFAEGSSPAVKVRNRPRRRYGEAAELWYDANRKEVTRYDEPCCHDMLIDLLPIAALKKKLGKQSKKTFMPSD